VYDDAGGIDDVPQSARRRVCGDGGGTLGEFGQGRCGPVAGEDGCTRFLKNFADSSSKQGGRKCVAQIV